MRAVRYEYQAPPEPEPLEGDNIIEVPEKEGTAATVLTHENGMTTYIFRERWDWEASARLAEFVMDTLANHEEEVVIGVPNSEDRTTYAWVPRHTWETMLHLHDAISGSPIAARKQQRERHILVPAREGSMTPIPIHGPGKRGRN